VLCHAVTCMADLPASGIEPTPGTTHLKQRQPLLVTAVDAADDEVTETGAGTLRWQQR